MAQTSWTTQTTEWADRPGRQTWKDGARTIPQPVAGPWEQAEEERAERPGRHRIGDHAHRVREERVHHHVHEEEDRDDGPDPGNVGNEGAAKQQAAHDPRHERLQRVRHGEVANHHLLTAGCELAGRAEAAAHDDQVALDGRA